ncbi:MAG TPA: hypothetical protein VK968_07895, partial [Roseimicrobium sp.]|nr:hypothetical protein [Roseimicrobium sp.]
LIYLPNQSGNVIVFKASPMFELVSVNGVGEYSNSSLAMSEGDILFRTYQNLWCIAAPKKTAAAARTE